MTGVEVTPTSAKTAQTEYGGIGGIFYDVYCEHRQNWAQ